MDATAIINNLAEEVKEIIDSMDLQYQTIDEAEQVAKKIADQIQTANITVFGYADMETQELIGEAIALKFAYSNNDNLRNGTFAYNDKNFFGFLICKNKEIDQNSIESSLECLSNILESKES
jgi:hypothetical protein